MMKLRLAVAAVVLASTPVAAQPFADVVEPAAPVAESYEEPTAIRRSYVIPAAEIFFGNIALNLACRAAGMEWAVIDAGTMKRNLTTAWVYDVDQFKINQIGHPYGGAMAFSTARSSGHGFWMSSLYAFVGSWMWEVFMENELPSVNDQITTPVGGAFLGEVLHRWGQSVRADGGADPGIARRVLAGLIDPVGELNAAVSGKAWRLVPPPRLHAHVGLGAMVQLGQGVQAPVQLELAVAHGLPSDLPFHPRRPFDHFDLEASIQAGTEEIQGAFDLRGLIVGRAIGDEHRRGLWGLYGSYDYVDLAGPRASVVAFGPGITAHQAIGERGFGTATAVVSVVPWGAAGGTGDGEGPQRDYHHGPGASGFVEVAAGRPGLGVVRVNARVLEVLGSLVGDANETVVVTTVGGMISLTERHAIGVEAVYAARSADFEDATMRAFDQSQELRLVYAITSDASFGGGDAH